MDKRDPSRKAWRDRLALRLRTFRKLMGRWPDRQIVGAAKRGCEDAIRQGIKPPYWH